MSDKKVKISNILGSQIPDFIQADNPLLMSKLTQKQIYNIIKPCGLGPQKSRAIKALSTILVKEYEGEVPEDIELLEKLPGVGHKTASVVMSQGFGHPAFPVDTHIHRLAQRWKLTNGKNVTQTENCLLYTSPSPRDQRGSRMPSSA
mgnify:CR=1 FL=1